MNNSKRVIKQNLDRNRMAHILIWIGFGVLAIGILLLGYFSKGIKPAHYIAIAVVGAGIATLYKELRSSDKTDSIKETGENTNVKVKELEIQNTGLKIKIDKQAEIISNNYEKQQKYADKIIEKNDLLVSLQEKLREKNEEIIKFNKRSELPLPNEALIYFDLSFDVVSNNLESFEKIVLESVPNELVERAKNDPTAPFVNIPDVIQLSPSNPFLWFTHLFVGVIFKQDDKSYQYSIGSQFYIKMATNENQFSFAQKIFNYEDPQYELLAGYHEPLLNVSYSPNERKFFLSCKGKRLLSQKSMINSGSLYDLVGTTMEVNIVPTGSEYNRDKYETVNKQFSSLVLYNLDNFSIRSKNYFWFEFGNKLQKVYVNSDSQKINIYKIKLTEKDLKLTKLNTNK